MGQDHLRKNQLSQDAVWFEVRSNQNHGKYLARKQLKRILSAYFLYSEHVTMGPAIADQIDGETLKRTCGTLRKFQNHYKITEIVKDYDDDDEVTEDDDEEKGSFTRCSKCNRPTICHEKPINSLCKKEHLDIDDLDDLEMEIRKRDEFSSMEKKAIANIKKTSDKKEKDRARTCDICNKLFKTVENLKTHQEKQHEDQSSNDIGETLKRIEEDRKEERKAFMEMIKQMKEPASQPKSLGTTKFTECPKWKKEDDFQSFTEATLLWDGYTSAPHCVVPPALKLNSLLESMKDEHPSEHKRMVFDTLKNPQFMDKIRDEDDSKYDKETAKKVIKICLEKLKDYFGNSKTEELIKSYRGYKNLEQKSEELIVDFIRRFDSMPSKISE